MSGPPPEDRIHLLPALFVGGHEIALEQEIHGAWVDGTYHSRAERTPSIVLAIKLVRDLVTSHRQAQKEGRA